MMEFVDPLHRSEKQTSFSPNPMGKTEVRFSEKMFRPAGFSRRVIATMIDALIIGLLSQFLLFAGLMGIRLSNTGSGFEFSDIGAILFNGLLFVTIGYFTFFHAHDGQTPAKMMLRIKVVTREGRGLSPIHAFIRTLCYFLSAFFFGIGFIVTIFEPKKRALHDLLSGTEVILSP